MKTFETGNKDNDIISITSSYIQFYFYGEEGNSKLKTRHLKTVSFSNIKGIISDLKDSSLVIYANKTYQIKFASIENKNELIGYLKENLTECKYTEKLQSKFSIILSYGLVILVVLGMTYFIYSLASAIDSGDMSFKAGSKIKMIIYSIAKFIGPIGSLIIGGALSLILVAITVQSVKNPPLKAQLVPSKGSKIVS